MKKQPDKITAYYYRAANKQTDLNQMCIRDSANTGPYFQQSKTGDRQQNMCPLCHASFFYHARQVLIAVSYTHLDVYKRQLEYTPRPSLKNIQAILASGQDRAIPEQSTATASCSQYGFTRGADYNEGGNT